MMCHLGHVAVVHMGYSFRARVESVPSGNIAIIQMRDLTEDNRVDSRGLTRVDIESPKEHHLVRPGDLAFRSRGWVYDSAVVDADLREAMLVAPLFRIRVTKQSVLPEYLSWYISQPPAQAYLASHSRGTAQKMITKDALERMEVFIPPLERQQAIVQMAALAEQEQALMRKLAERRRQHVAMALMKIAEGESTR